MPALLASIIVSFLLFGGVAGFLWIFVSGDNPWPSSIGNWLMALLVFTCVTLWIAFMVAAYFVGKKQEVHPILNVRHVIASVGATLLLVLLVILQQWNVGNIGKKSNEVLCAEFCRDKGFAGSGMPPRNVAPAMCSCYDAQGRETMKINMED
jgi:hypothetical protein